MFVNLLIQIGTSESITQIICFRSEFQSRDRKSYDSDRDFGAYITNHLIQIGTLMQVHESFRGAFPKNNYGRKFRRYQ